MPKDNEHIGDRLKAEMEKRKLKPADIAKVFGVAGPSVYDWLNYGRIAKKHIPKLVQEYGHTAEWWIGGEEGEAIDRPAITSEQVEWLELIESLTQEQRLVFKQCFAALKSAAPESIHTERKPRSAGKQKKAAEQ